MIVSFQDYVPIPRYDGTPWTQVTIEESINETGPWTLIDTLALSPLDTDPKRPRARSFTTSLATLAEGWYRVSFKDAAGDVLHTDAVHNFPESDIDWRPTITRVAKKILSRTRDGYGNIQGTFTSTTTPADNDVAEIVTNILTEVADSIGDDIPSALWDDAANVAAIRAAMEIETSFFADQVNTGRSIYPQLKDQYDSALARLQRQVTLYAEGGTSVGDTGSGGLASGSFPDATGWMTRQM